MKLNGSIPNINLGLSASVIGLLVFTIVVGGYYVSETRTISERNGIDIDTIKKNQDVFVKTWLDTQRSQNKISNETESQLLNLSRTNDKIIKQQIENERMIINNTNKTNSLVGFLADNFGENSDYLQKENFQYKQANETFKTLQDNSKLFHQLNNSSNITR